MIRNRVAALAALYACLSFGGEAKAAATMTTALPAAGALTGADLFACVQGGTSVKCTATQMTAYTFSLASGDCVSSGVGAFTCTKTNNVSFGTLATLSAAPAGTLTGATLAAGVTGSSLTSVGTLVGGSTGAGFTVALSTATITGTLAAARFPAFTGDITTSAGAVATTLATVNSNVGSFGTSTSIPSFTVNGKGLVTAASGNAVVAPAGTLSGTTLASGVTLSSLTALGTIDTGVWNATKIEVNKGGTGTSSSGMVYAPGAWYVSYGNTFSATGVATIANRIACYPHTIKQKLTFTNVAILVTTLSAAGTEQIAFYTDSGGRPGAFIRASADMSTATATTVTAALTASVQLGPGGTDGDERTWVCSNSNNSTAIFKSANVVGGMPSREIGADTAANALSGAVNPSGVGCTGAACTGGSSTYPVANVWPASLAGSTWAVTVANHPHIAIQVTSVP